MADTLATRVVVTAGLTAIQSTNNPTPRTRLRATRSPLGALWAVLRSVVVIAALLALWEIAPRAGWVDSSIVPPVSTVLKAWWELAQNGQLWDNTHASLQRAALGFGIAVAVGVPLGIVIGWYKLVHQLLDPVLELFRNTAALALLPVFTVLLGIGETSKVAIIVYASFFPVVLSTISGVRTVDPLLVKSARSMGLSPLALFAKVVLPSAVPSIFTGVRMAGASSILVLIAAEMVGAKAGLGYLINYAQFNFEIPEMYAGIITISVIGLVVNLGLVRLERRFSRWRVDVRG